MKAIFMPIQSQPLFNILNDNKTLELRKSVPGNFVGWVYLYCTKAKPYLNNHASWFLNYEDFIITRTLDNEPKNYKDYFYGFSANGKVVARFWFDEWEEIIVEESCYNGKLWSGRFEDNERLQKHYLSAHITENEFHKYSKGTNLYAWHIKKLQIFDKPMELSEFYTDWDTMDTDPHGNYVGWYEIGLKQLTKAPQSWQYVWVKE